LDQSDPFIGPTGSAAIISFTGLSKLKKSDRSFVRPVAVRSCAVNDKYRFAEEHKVNRVGSEGRIHIGAIGLKRELLGKMLKCSWR